MKRPSASAVDPVFVILRPTFVRADAAVAEAERRVQRDDAADVIADADDTLRWKRCRVGELLAVVGVVRHGHLLGPGVDEPAKRDLVVAAAPIRRNVGQGILKQVVKLILSLLNDVLSHGFTVVLTSISLNFTYFKIGFHFH